MSQRTPLTVKRQLTLGFGGLALASVLVAGMAARGLDAGNERFKHHVEGVGARATTMASLGISSDVIDECLNHMIQSRVTRI